ncbi:hypothetical protein ABIB25_002868 [Nakamurella sp. UYEF19]|uniref:DUF4232 domain-containing protein n=1 Tax=Nakamurella sp. UYEF19 TaxID=1756392 RepID=UPI0033961E63
MATTFAMVAAVAVAVAGCGEPGPATATSATSDQTQRPVEVTDANGMRPGVVPSTRVEPPSGADRPDGAAPTPDRKLSADELKALIGTPASAGAATDRCSARDVSVALSGSEAAAGHRYAQLIAANTSGRTCTLVGWPGLGLRGAWGTAFATVVERSTIGVDRIGVPPADAATAVTMAPGGRAAAEFEWTGALAGVRDEPVSLIAVQFTVDGDPAVALLDPDERVDIGPETTVRVGPWGQAG